MRIGIIAIFLCTFLFGFNKCENRLFTIHSTPGIKIKEYIDNLAQECELTLFIKDKYAKKILDTPLQRLHLTNVTLEQLLHFLLEENNLDYQLQNNILKIRYLLTKTFKLDYVTTKRKSQTTTDASVDVGAIATNATGGSGGGVNTPGTTVFQGRDINKIEATDEFDFWSKIPQEIEKLLNRPEDEYKAPPPIVNPNAGLVTITATKKQITRVANYLQEMEERLHQEVLIDVSIYAVVLKKNSTTGIDWSRFSLLINGEYNNQNQFTPTNPLYQYQSVGTGTNFKNLDYTTTAMAIINSSFHLSGIINFLHTSGDVITLSNPKVLTLNNQPAIITVGDTLNYNVPTQITIKNNNDLGEMAYTPSSIFVGILLNITPQITKDGKIILRINPSISELRNPEDATRTIDPKTGFRMIAPDTSEKKISSVVKVDDGATLILGGLISNTKNFMINGVPVLQDIPLFGNLFKSKKKHNQRFELVFILRPKIIHNKTPLSDLRSFGYEKINK